MANEITVPVRLQVLQDSISEFQKILNNLQPNTSNWKILSKLIENMVSESQKLQAQLSKPFSSQAQFNSTKKTIDKLEETSARVKVVMDSLKFSDIKLTPQQTSELQKFDNEINQIRESYSKLQEQVKVKLLSNTNTENLIGSLKGKILEKNFFEIESAIDNHINNLRRQVIEKDKQYNELISSKQLGKSATKLVTEGLNEGSIGTDIFNKYLRQTDTGLQVKSWNNGVTKQALLDAIGDMYYLEPGELQKKLEESLGKSLKAININEISKFFAGLGTKDSLFSGIIRKGAGATSNAPIISAEVESLRSQLHEYEAIAQEIARLKNTELTPVSTQNEARISELTRRFNELKNSIFNNSTAVANYKSGAAQMSQATTQLRTTLEQTNAQFIQMQRVTQNFNAIKQGIINFMGFNQIVRLTKTAIKEAINHIKELDTVMNKISIVTDMSTADLWGQVDAYSKMAQTYGVSIKGAYEVSQIYYQQGLETNDVMTLTNETLKLAKISGLDYAQTTDYMTTALRGFKMEMSEASTVVDVYSNLAANTAVSQEELAVAMSKTASSMEGVGASFEESSAMIATMVAVTRESATNIGSAMKSIASRYGELTKDPTKLVDEDGEAMAFNKVDAALQSVGISMKTVDGQFREFTEVIVELADKWDQLDTTQQRYIATQFAGNRQQSRFLALVSNKDLLNANLQVAANSEDTGTLQALKALDSIESKLNQVQVAYQQFYTTVGAESIWKGLLDGTKNVINTLNSLPKLFGKIPVSAIGMLAGIISMFKDLAIKILSGFSQQFGQNILNGITGAIPSAKSGAQLLIESVDDTFKGAGSKWAVTLGKAVQTATGQVTTTTIKPEQLTGENKIKYDKNVGLINSIDHALNGDSSSAKQRAYWHINALETTKQISKETADSLRNNTNGPVVALQNFKKELVSTNQEFLILKNTSQQSMGGIKQFFAAHSEGISKTMTQIGPAIQMIGMLIDTSTRGGKVLSGSLMGLGGVVSTVGGIWQGFVASVKTGNSVLSSIPWMAVISGIFAAINGISTLIVTPEEKLEELQKKAEELSNIAKEEKANYNILDRSIKKIDELKEKRYESAEAAEEYQTAVDELADKFPEMIQGFDTAGNIILSTKNAEEALTAARQASAQATYNAIKAENEAQQQKVTNTKAEIRKTLSNINTEIENYSTQAGFDETSQRMSLFYKDLVTLDENFTSENLLELPVEDLFSKLYNVNTNASFLKKYIDVSNFDYKLKEGWTPESILQDININELNENQQKLYESLKDLLIPSQLNEDISNIQSQLYNLLNDSQLQDYSSQESQKAITQLYTTLLNFEKIYGKEGLEKLFGNKDNKGLNEQLIQLMSSIPTEIGTLDGLERAEISAWNNLYNSQNTYLEKSASLAVVATNEIQKLTGEENFQTWIDNNKSEVDKINQALEEFYTSLSPDSVELLDKMLSDETHYTYEDIIEQFKIVENDPVRLYFEHYYDTFKSVNERLNQSLAKSIGKRQDDTGRYEEVTDNDVLQSFYKNYYEIINKKRTEVEEKYLNSILSQYDSLKSSSYTQRASDFGDAAIKLFTLIDSQEATLEAQLWDLINTNGLTTLEGIQTIIDSIDNNENIQNKTEFKEYLTTLYNNIIPNINLAIQTATSNLLETWEDTSKELTAAMTGGVSLKEADALINKAKALGVEGFDLSSFVNTGDKLILGVDEFNIYLKKLNEATGKNIEEWQQRIIEADSAIKIFEVYGKVGGAPYTKAQLENYKAALESVGFNWGEDSSYWDELGKLTDAGIDAALEAIKNNKNAFNNFTLAQKIALDQLTNAYDRNRGIYKVSDVEKSVDELKQIASNTKLTKDQYTERAIKEQLNSVYSTLITDILSKGFSQINVDDYEGLIALDDTDLRNLIEKGKIGKYTYSEFIQRYAELAGYSIDETNDLIIQAIEKENEQLDKGAAGEALKDITFYSNKLAYASLDTINKLANIFDIPVQDILGEYNKLLGGYQVKLDNVDLHLQELDSFAELVQESVQSIIDSIIGFASSAISGKLSQTDKLSLNAQLSAMGISELQEIDFSETADGLKLSEAAAIRLYSALKQINSIKAQSFFDDLKDSILKANESLSSASGIQAKISALRKQLEAARASADEAVRDDQSERKSAVQATVEALEQELSLYEEIASVQQFNSPESYKFMDQALPDYLQGPENYWNAWSKATSAINDSAKTGTMGLSDFRNIVNEMNNLAKVSGTTIDFLGRELNGDMVSAANLIEEGFGALKTIDGGDVVVDLGKIGINFAAGAAGLGDNVEKGIDDIAQSQIDMLDSMIALLETVVAMEKLGDITTGDGTIDLDDLFPDINTDSYKLKEGKITDWANELIKTDAKSSLGKAIDSIILNNKSFREWLKQATTEGIQTKEDAELFTATMNSLYQMMLSGNYDLKNLISSISQIASQSGFSGEIQIGNIKLGIGYGYTLTTNEKDEWVVDGKTYTSLQDALTHKALLEEKDLQIDIANINGGEAHATYQIGEMIFDVEAKDSEVTYTYKEQKVGSQRDAVQMAYETLGEADESKVEFGKRLNIDSSLTVDSVNITNAEEFAKITHEQVIKVAEALSNNNIDEVINIAKDVGVAIDVDAKGNITEDSYQQITKLFGIDSKTAILDITANAPAGEGANILAELLKGEDPITKTISIPINVTGDYSTILIQNVDGSYTLFTADSNPITITSLAEIPPELIGDSTKGYTIKTADEATIKVSAGLNEVTDLIGDATTGFTIVTTSGKVITVPAELGALTGLIKTSDNKYTISTTTGTIIKVSAELGDVFGLTKDVKTGNYTILTTSGEKIEVPVEAGMPQELIIDSNGKCTVKTTTGEKIEIPIGISNDNLITKTAKGYTVVTTETDPISISTSANMEGFYNDILAAPIPTKEINAKLNNKEALAQLKKDLQTRQAIVAGNIQSFEQNDLTAAGIKSYARDWGISENAAAIKLMGMYQAAMNELNELNQQITEIDILLSSDSQNLNEEVGAIAVEVNAEINDLQAAIMAAQQYLSQFELELDNISIQDFINWLNSLDEESKKQLTFDVEEAKQQLEQIQKELNKIPLYEQIRLGITDNVTPKLNTILNYLNNIQSKKNIVITTHTQNSQTDKGGGSSGNELANFSPVAKGNVALAKGRKTLLGELGPELVVSHGRYFIAGQNGAEFVNLDDDAIVFNHLQTKKLLSSGSSGRGAPITNEHNAVSFATGNAQGPAMASASDALAALKQLKAMWESIKGLSIKDLAGAGGGGGGGGKNDMKTFIDQVERWYNLLQKIAKLEVDITHQEKLRSKLSSDLQSNGAAYYESQRKSIEALLQEAVATETLIQSKKDYRTKRIAELNQDQALNRFYTFDENTNLLQFNDQDLGYKALADLVAQGVNNAPLHTLEEQIKMLQDWGLSEYMKYDSNGEEIKVESGKEQDAYAKMVEAAWNWIDSGRQQIQDLNDSINENEDKALEIRTSINNILAEIRDNQLAIEEKILNAIEEREQAIIDKLQDERDAIEESSEKFITGLNNQLSKERDMYKRNQDATELSKLRNQLAILQRSGGSASAIRSLQESINTKTQESYFEEQQRQIDAIEEASDKEIERLDRQIDIMTEALEYNKENGLFWDEVTEVMNKTPAEINDFIVKNTAEWKSYSTAQWEKNYQELNNIVTQWKAFQSNPGDVFTTTQGDVKTIADALNKTSDFDWDVYDKAMEDYLGEDWKKIRDQMKIYFEKANSATGDPTQGMTEVGKQSEFKGATAENITPSEKGSTSSSTETKEEENKHYRVVGEIKKDGVWTWAVLRGGFTSIKDAENDLEWRKDKKDKYRRMSVESYSKGGLIKYTGLAMVHGSPSEPESILNAEETKTWKNEIMGSQENSLMSLLMNYRDSIAGMINADTYSTITRNENIVIENASVNMNVASIANEYDARQAGADALDEILRIAKRSNLQNNVRR